MLFTFLTTMSCFHTLSLPALLKGICHKERTHHQIQFARDEQYINGIETGAGF